MLLHRSRVIWLGDLNYRIALSYCSAKALVEMHSWKQLLEKDQVIRCVRVCVCLVSIYFSSFLSEMYFSKFEGSVIQLFQKWRA